MAVSTGRTHCVTCGRERIACKCEGCSENFCFDHLVDHRHALDEQLDKVEDDRKTNTGSPFDVSLSQAFTSGSTPPFRFTKPSTTDTFNPRFPNLSFLNVSRFSFGSLQPENPPFQITQPISNSQVQQSLETFTITSSTQTQEISNNISQSSFPLKSTNRPKQMSATNKASIAERSLIAKKINTILRDSNANVVDRNDPNSLFNSLTSFQELKLKPDLLKGIYNMGFSSPSKIQAIALPRLLGNPPRNIIAQAQSGTGKTAAFSLAIISRIDPSVQSPQALILAPTFELVIQIGSIIERMAQFLPYIQVAYAVRVSSMSKKHNLIYGQLLPEPIVIGTPGTVEDWYRRLRVINLSQLRICCVDEADVMIATENFRGACVDLVNGLNISKCQMMLFSATYSDEIMAFASKIVPNPFVSRLIREKETLVNIRQFFIRCYDKDQKDYAIEQMYSSLTVGQAMIFCQTKATALDLTIRMELEKHSVREIMSILDIEQREAVIKQFREGVFRVLISTNIAARGLDIDDVTLVINYDMPVTVDFQPDYETYLHRIGRCGRFGKLGYAFNLIGSEKDFNIMKSIEQYFNHRIDEISIEDLNQLEQLE